MERETTCATCAGTGTEWGEYTSDDGQEGWGLVPCSACRCPYCPAHEAAGCKCECHARRASDGR